MWKMYKSRVPLDRPPAPRVGTNFPWKIQQTRWVKVSKSTLRSLLVKIFHSSSCLPAVGSAKWPHLGRRAPSPSPQVEFGRGEAPTTIPNNSWEGKSWSRFVHPNHHECRTFITGGGNANVGAGNSNPEASQGICKAATRPGLWSRVCCFPAWTKLIPTAKAGFF